MQSEQKPMKTMSRQNVKWLREMEKSEKIVGNAHPIIVLTNSSCERAAHRPVDALPRSVARDTQQITIRSTFNCN